MSTGPPQPKISAILLAAGQSRRMGAAHKLLLPLAGQPVLARTLDILEQSRLAQIIVVLGHGADQLRPILAGRKLTTVENRRYTEGLTSSIQAGVKAAAPDADGLMICLADMVLLQAADVDALIESFAQVRAEPAIIVPTSPNRRGNPVLFHAGYRAEILALTEPNGCKPLLQHHADAVIPYPTTANSYFQDLDTPEDYQQVLEQLS